MASCPAMGFTESTGDLKQSPSLRRECLPPICSSAVSIPRVGLLAQIGSRFALYIYQAIHITLNRNWFNITCTIMEFNTMS